MPGGLAGENCVKAKTIQTNVMLNLPVYGVEVKQSIGKGSGTGMNDVMA